MPRTMLTDEFWSKLWIIMSQNGIYDKPELRLTTEGILYKMRTGCPWRDLPCYFGNWKIERTPESRYTIADKGYDGEYFRWVIEEMDSIAVIPRKSNSKIGNDDLDKFVYKQRHLVENIFARIKHFRSIATRFDKLKRNFEGMLYLACSYIWLKIGNPIL